MPHWKRHQDQSASKYLHQSELVARDGITPKDYTLQIAEVGPFLEKKDKYRDDSPMKKTRKLLITFRIARKQFVCNPTNALIIQGLYGPDDTKWVGKWITIYANPNVFFGKGKSAKQTGGISVRPEVPPQNAPIDVPEERDEDPAKREAIERALGPSQ